MPRSTRASAPLIRPAKTNCSNCTGMSAPVAGTGAEYVDRGVSGAKDRRPSLDQLVIDARKRRFDVLIVWHLNRLGRNLRHLVTLLEGSRRLGLPSYRLLKASTQRLQPGSSRCTFWLRLRSSRGPGLPNAFVLAWREFAQGVNDSVGGRDLLAIGTLTVLRPFRCGKRLPNRSASFGAASREAVP